MVFEKVRRLTSAAVIVTLLCATGVEVLCALPCAEPAAATAAQSEHDHCAATAPGPEAALASTATGCASHEGLAPAIDSGIRRSTNATAGAVIQAAGDALERIFIAGPADSSPPGLTTPRLNVPLRI